MMINNIKIIIDALPHTDNHIISIEQLVHASSLIITIIIVIHCDDHRDHNSL